MASTEKKGKERNKELDWLMLMALEKYSEKLLEIVG